MTHYVIILYLYVKAQKRVQVDVAQHSVQLFNDTKNSFHSMLIKGVAILNLELCCPGSSNFLKGHF